MTRAPKFAASFGVPSVLPESITRTSSDQVTLAMQRSMLMDSLCVRITMEIMRDCRSRSIAARLARNRNHRLCQRRDATQPEKPDVDEPCFAEELIKGLHGPKFDVAVIPKGREMRIHSAA